MDIAISPQDIFTLDEEQLLSRRDQFRDALMLQAANATSDISQTIYERAISELNSFETMQKAPEGYLRMSLISAASGLMSNMSRLERLHKENPLRAFDEKLYNLETGYLSQILGTTPEDLKANPVPNTYDFEIQKRSYKDNRVEELIRFAEEARGDKEKETILRRLKFISHVRDGIEMIHRVRLRESIRIKDRFESYPNDLHMFDEVDYQNRAITRYEEGKLHGRSNDVINISDMQPEDFDFVVGILGVKDVDEFREAVGWNMQTVPNAKDGYVSEHKVFSTKRAGFKVGVRFSKYRSDSKPDHEIFLAMENKPAVSVVMAPVLYPDNISDLASYLFAQTKKVEEESSAG